MKGMLQFSIREAILTSITVAVCLAWWVDRQSLLSDLERARAWRFRTGALEFALEEEGWNVDWHLDRDEVTVWTTENLSGSTYKNIKTDAIEPGTNEP